MENYSMNSVIKARNIVGEMGLTIYQTRAYLYHLHIAGMMKKVNSGRGVAYSDYAN